MAVTWKLSLIACLINPIRYSMVGRWYDGKLSLSDCLFDIAHPILYRGDYNGRRMV